MTAKVTERLTGKRYSQANYIPVLFKLLRRDEALFNHHPVQFLRPFDHFGGLLELLFRRDAEPSDALLLCLKSHGDRNMRKDLPLLHRRQDMLTA